MNRLTGSILLQNQDAWPLWVTGVILDHHGSFQSVNDIAYVDTVRSELLVAVERYAHFAARHECPYLFQCLTQFRDPPSPEFVLSRQRPRAEPRRARVSIGAVGSSAWLAAYAITIAFATPVVDRVRRGRP